MAPLRASKPSSHTLSSREGILSRPQFHARERILSFLGDFPFWARSQKWFFFIPSSLTSHFSQTLDVSLTLTIFSRDFVKETKQDLVESFPLVLPPFLGGTGCLGFLTTLVRLFLGLAAVGTGPLLLGLLQAGHLRGGLLLAGQDLFDQGQGVILLAQVL